MLALAQYRAGRQGEALRTLEGSGAPAKRIPWLGDTDRQKVEQGEIYQYQLQVTYLDGSIFSTGRELFGVNRHEAVLLTLSGGAFVFDRSELTLEAKRLLKGAARVLRARPREKVIVEGHTDGIGSVEYNMALSQRRCDTAAEYLVREEGIAASRLLRRWYGKSRPVADDVTTPGRRMNRRVELKGDFKELHPVSPDDRYRTKPFVVINGRSIPVDSLGRFDTTFPGHTLDLDLEMGDSQGRFLATSLPLPDLAVTEPPAETLVGYGTEASGVRVDVDGKAHCMLSGKVEGTSMEVAGRKVPLDEAGRFTLDLPLAEGDQVLGVVLRNGSGCSKLMNLRLRSERQTMLPARGER
jgi:outer membrane protein OmpA-like peptidoglycan-associated protein